MILLKKNFEFISNRKNSTIAFNLGFMLLLEKTDSILKKQSCKKDMLLACSSYYIKIILILLIKVLAVYI